MLTDAKLCSSLATTLVATLEAPAAEVAVPPVTVMAPVFAFAFDCVPAIAGIKLLMAAACAIKSVLSSRPPMPIE